MGKKGSTSLAAVLILGLVILAPTMIKYFNSLILGNTCYKYKVLREHYFTDSDYKRIAEEMDKVTQKEFEDMGMYVDCTDMYDVDYTKYIMTYAMDAYFKSDIPAIDKGKVTKFIENKVLPMFEKGDPYTYSVLNANRTEFIDSYIENLENDAKKVNLKGMAKSYKMHFDRHKTRIIIYSLFLVIAFVVAWKQQESILMALQSYGIGFAAAGIFTYVKYRDIENVFKGSELIAKDNMAITEYTSLSNELSTKIVDNLEDILQLADPYLILVIVAGIVLAVLPFILDRIVISQYSQPVVVPQKVDDKYDDLDDFLMQNDAPVQPSTTETPAFTNKPSINVDSAFGLSDTESLKGDISYGSSYESSYVTSAEPVSDTDSQLQEQSDAEKRAAEEQAYDDFSSLFGNFSTFSDDSNRIG